MFNKTNFARALLVLASAALIACGGGQAEIEGSGGGLGRSPQVRPTLSDLKSGDGQAGSEGSAGTGGSPEVRTNMQLGTPVTLSDLKSGDGQVGSEGSAWTGGSPEVAAITQPGAPLTLSDVKSDNGQVGGEGSAGTGGSSEVDATTQPGSPLTPSDLKSGGGQAGSESSAATGGSPVVGAITQAAAPLTLSDVKSGSGQAGSEGSAGTGGSPQVRTITHPGAPLTLSDLKTLKAHVDQGKEPWKSAYGQLTKDGKAQLTYVMQGPFMKVSRAPNENLWPWRNDMVAIWNLSRMWYFTQDDRYAKKAREILREWATTQKEFSGRESMLDLGDYAYKFVGGAEILRGTWPGWTEDDTAVVKKYFKDVLMPASNPYGESQFGAANKGALALVSLGLLSIFNDDIESLDKVVYRTRTLAHIGLRSSNNLGLLGDSLRDQGHAHGQLLSLAMLAEALWKQGIDVYSDFDNRLLSAGEYFARVNELAPTPFLPFGTTDAYYLADNTNRGWGGGNIALNLIHGAYVVRKGMQAPYVTQRNRSLPVDSTSFMFLKDADTSKATPGPGLPIPSTTSITSGFRSVDIGGASPAGAATYAAGKWTVVGAGAEIWGGNDSCQFTYKPITGNSAIIAKVESIQNTSLSAKAGVMMRTSLDPGAPRAWMAITNRNQGEQNMPKLAVYGGANYGNKAFNIANSVPSYWVKLERIGNIITGYVSPDGTNWAATDVGRIDAPVPDTIYVGLVVSSNANGKLNASTFSNVQITGGDGGAPSVIPAAPAMLLASPGDGEVPLRWQESFGATSYTVKRSTSSGGPYSTIASGVTGSSYTDRSVSNGTTFYYTVTATNSAGTSGSSPTDSATPVRPMVN